MVQDPVKYPHVPHASASDFVPRESPWRSTPSGWTSSKLQGQTRSIMLKCAKVEPENTRTMKILQGFRGLFKKRLIDLNLAEASKQQLLTQQRLTDEALGIARDTNVRSASFRVVPPSYGGDDPQACEFGQAVMLIWKCHDRVVMLCDVRLDLDDGRKDTGNYYRDTFLELIQTANLHFCLESKPRIDEIRPDASLHMFFPKGHSDTLRAFVPNLHISACVSVWTGMRSCLGRILASRSRV